MGGCGCADGVIYMWCGLGGRVTAVRAYPGACISFRHTSLGGRSWAPKHMLCSLEVGLIFEGCRVHLAPWHLLSWERCVGGFRVRFGFTHATLTFWLCATPSFALRATIDLLIRVSNVIHVSTGTYSLPCSEVSLQQGKREASGTRAHCQRFPLSITQQLPRMTPPRNVQ